MKILYDSKKIEKYFRDLDDVPEKGNELKRKVGPELARSIKKRYDQIKALPDFYQLMDFPLGKPEPLENTQADYSLRVDANYRLIIMPESKTKDPEELKKCTTVIIKGVVDYHGGKNNWILP